MPPVSFESAFSIRIILVSDFLPEVTQHIHSLRASGVISFHTACAGGVDIRALCKSVGNLCTAPVELLFLIIELSFA